MTTTQEFLGVDTRISEGLIESVTACDSGQRLVPTLFSISGMPPGECDYLVKIPRLPVGGWGDIGAPRCRYTQPSGGEDEAVA